MAARMSAFVSVKPEPRVDVGRRRLEPEPAEPELRVLVAELLRDLVPADLREVVALRVEEQVGEQLHAPSRASAARPGAACGRCR